MIKEKLPIHKQFLVISAPVPFRLIANNGTDSVERPAGVWQLDTYKLLPEKFMKNYPVFTLELEYDESKIEDGFNFEYYFTNINLGDSLKGVSGDLVELSDYQFNVLKNMLSYSEDFPSYQEIGKKIETPISEEYSKVTQITISPAKKRNIYMGCVVVTKEGLRFPSTVKLLYSPTIDKCFDYNLKFFYKVEIDGHEPIVLMKHSTTVIQTYENGLFPSYTFVTDNTERIKDFLIRELISFADIDRLEFFLLTDK